MQEQEKTDRKVDRRAFLKILGAAGATAVVAAACQPAPGQTPVAPTAVPPTAGAPTQVAPPKAVKPTGTFVGLIRQPPSTIDPAIGSDNPTRKILIAIYEPLIRVKPNTADLEPWLAESWSVSADGKSYTFKLRKGVKFHDGTEMDSTAVKASFERMKKVNLGNAWALADVAQINTPDPLTVTVVLNKVSTPFLYSIPLIYIVSPKAIQGNAKGDDLAQPWFAQNEAGTGPFALSQWEKNQKLVFTAFDSYWGGWKANQFGTMTLQQVPEGATQRIMMAAGQADWADTIGVDDLLAMQKDAKYTVISRPSITLMWLMMNTKKKPLDDPKVRRAMRYAFDTGSMIKDIMQGLGDPAKGYLPPGYAENIGFADEVYDPVKAKALLTEAGYPNGGFTLDLMYFTPYDWERMGSEMLADRLSKLGITIKMEGLPWASMLTKFQDPTLRPHFAFYSATGTTSSPDSLFSQTFSLRSSHWSQYGYGNPKVDELIDAAKIELDAAKRTKIYQDIQTILHADSPGINTFIVRANHVFPKSVGGYAYLTFMPDIIDYYPLYRAT